MHHIVYSKDTIEEKGKIKQQKRKKIQNKIIAHDARVILQSPQ